MRRHTSNTRREPDSGRLCAGLAALVVLAVGCGDNLPGFNETPPPPPRPAELQLLHAADQEAGIPAVQDAPRFAAVVSALRDKREGSTLVLSSGDNYIPGPFLSAGADPALRGLVGHERVGRADIIIHNAIGFDASALGNHEFDLGLGAVEDMIGKEDRDDDDDGVPDRTYPGTAFPYLSCNMDFTGTELEAYVVDDGQEASSIPNSIARTAIITRGQAVFGVVGAVTPTLPQITSLGSVTTVTPGPTASNAEIAAVLQECVDSLTEQGVNKIILISHMQQLSVERELATLLEDVDIIVGGGSNTILADADDRLRSGDTAADTYPLQFTSASGDPVLVVNTDGNYRYVGRLMVEFDPQGIIDLDSLDPAINGIYATDDQGVEDLEAEAIDQVSKVAAAIGKVIQTKDGELYGKTDVYLDGARRSVRTQETQLGNLSADANLVYARAIADQLFAGPAGNQIIHASIKNGGGIRDSIGVLEVPPGGVGTPVPKPPAANPDAGKSEGDISRLDIENSLRFNNNLSIVKLTAAQLKEVMEHAVSDSDAGDMPDATPGRFAQVGGMRFSFDPTKDARITDGDGNVTQAGKRIQNLLILDPAGGSAHIEVVKAGALQSVGPFRVVTLGFLAGGGDGYPFPDDTAAEVTDLRDDPAATPPVVRPDGCDTTATFSPKGGEQHAFACYMKDTFTSSPFNQAEQPFTNDNRVQNLSAGKTDTVLNP